MKSTPVEEQIRGARELACRLSNAHFRTAAYLMRHLSLIAEKSSFTNMDAANLALVWSPNLFRCGFLIQNLEIYQICSVKSTRDQMSNMSSQNILVEIMIKFYKEVFYDFGMSEFLGYFILNILFLYSERLGTTFFSPIKRKCSDIRTE